MSEFVGSIQAIELVASLWLVPALPLLGAIIVSFVAPDRARYFCMALALAALLVLAMNIVTLLGQPSDQQSLVNHLFSVIQVGSLDVALAFALDRATALMASLTGILAVTAMAKSDLARASRLTLGVQSFGLAGAFTSILADNLFVSLLGWHATGLALYVLIGASDREIARRYWAGRVYVAARAAEALKCAALLCVFWGIEGSFSRSGEYTPDFKARLYAIPSERQGTSGSAPTETAAGHERRANGLLSFTALAGSRVELGGAELCAVSASGAAGGLATTSRPCRVVARSPFVRLPLPSGRYDARISPGPGTDELLVQTFRIEAEQETRIAVVGATLEYRSLSDQLTIRERSRSSVVELANKSIWGLPLVEVTGALFLLSALVKAGFVSGWSWTSGLFEGRARWASAFVAWSSVIAAASMGIRLGSWFVPEASVFTVVALIGLILFGVVERRKRPRETPVTAPAEGARKSKRRR